MKQEIKTRTGSIRVYDDVFTRIYREDVYAFCKRSMFQIGGSDGNIPEYQQNCFLQSSFSSQDIINLNIMEHLNKSELADEIKGRFPVRTLVNLSVPTDTYFAHIHPEELVLLYYVNLEWRENWHGETLFFDDAQKDIVYASQYTPGRIIAFTGSIPHTVRPPSASAPFYRLTMALNFK